MYIVFKCSSKSYFTGIKAKQVIDEARHNVATMIGAKSTGIYYIPIY
jgi:cysteine sulfinate desulfinase/cysteine desulfurase-like protein